MAALRLPAAESMLRVLFQLMLMEVAEGKVIGCLTGTGGVADEVDYLLSKFSKKTDATIFRDDDPGKLIDACLSELQKRAVN